jgi:hypothetical protein
MRFETSRDLVEGQILNLHCELCSAVARVTNRRSSRNDLQTMWLVGVEFVTIRFAATRGAFISTTA